MWHSIFSKWIPVGLGVALLAILPRLSWACSVCFDARPDGRIAYYGTTLLLTLLPLLLLSGFIWWVYRTLSYK